MQLSELKVQGSYVYKWHWQEVEEELHARIYYQQHNDHTFSFAVLVRLKGGYFHTPTECNVLDMFSGVINKAEEDFNWSMVVFDKAPFSGMGRYGVKFMASVFKTLYNLSETLLTPQKNGN